jgi:hydroxymethylbilane synthase
VTLSSLSSITIATRRSRLALWQAEHVKALLEERHGVKVKLLPIVTAGDRFLEAPLYKIGGKGLFIKEIEDALLDGRADLAVHSMKDMPAESVEGLVLGAIPEREDPSDIFLSKKWPGLEALPPRARVGTSSLRRQAQLLHLRPELEVVSLRGNVDTRLRKLEEGQFEAMVLATAGLRRLGLNAPFEQVLGSPAFLSAAGQGALGVQHRADREDVAELVAFMDHAPTRICVTAERAFLAELGGGCQVPVAAHAVVAKNDQELILDGLVAEPDGSRIIRREIRGAKQEAAALGTALARSVVEAGGGDILEKIPKPHIDPLAIPPLDG